MMYLTLPVSMYFSFSFGKVVTAKAAQCGQVIEAYSMMVTGAVGEPIGMSSSAPLASNSSTEKVCASARPPRPLNASKAPKLPSTLSASVAEVVVTNCRRVIITINLRLLVLEHSGDFSGPVALSRRQRNLRTESGDNRLFTFV